ncbi:MAG: RNA polymerase-binding transcription factor DksA [Gammaproteobacteria bacterium]|nr:RNA polymerase-binding transcription factor DksA [Gammaproteobacteria bacterium]
MPHLTPEQIQTLDQLMDARWAREIAEIDAVAARSRDERRQEAIAGRAADRLDEALAEVAQSTDYAIVRQNIEDVRDIAAARKRLAAGTYGVCTDCGAEIGYERLLAYPTAKRCIRCQRERERQEAILPRRGTP